MLLAFYVWSMELWIRGLDQKRWWLLALVMLFVSAAVLTKYFGITLLPLLAVYTLARDRRCWRQLLWFCFPIVAVAVYDFLSQAQYGHALFVSAANYSREVAAKYKFHCPHKYLPVSLLSGAASLALHFLSRYDGAVFASAPQSYCFSPWLLHSISLSQGNPTTR